MSGQQAETAAGTAAAAPSGGLKQRLRAALADLRQLPGWVRRNPLRAAGASGVLLVVLGIFAALATWLLPGVATPAPTMEQALKALESGDDAAARQIAMAVRSDPKLSYAEQGGPLYVLGTAIANDADKLWNLREKRLLHVVAAKYLQEARNHGFPPGHEANGAFQLGKSWFLAGNPESASEALRSSLELETSRASEARTLLAECYLLSTPPQYERALKVNADYLLTADLSDAQRQAGRLREARIHLALGQLAKCQQALDKVPAATSWLAERAIVQAQLLLAQGDAVAAGDPGKADDAQVLFQQAAETLRSIPNDDASHKDSLPAVRYLLGVCFERLGDDDAAIAQYSRLHRQIADTPEKVAALLREADLLLRHKSYDEGVQLVVKAMSDKQQAFGVHNRWITHEEIRQRLGAMQQSLVDAGAFAAALELADMPAGLVPAWQLALWKTNAYEAQAAAAEREAETSPLIVADKLRAKARADHRRAGREAARLAELRSLMREYTDDLWRSATQFHLGRDFPHSIEATKNYLHNESKKRRPDALLLMAESQLALDQADLAIATLAECLESFPNHPTAYRARLVAAQAYAEKGLLGDAKQLLAANVDSDALSPRSSQWRDSLFLLGKLLHREGVEHEAKSRARGVDSDDPQRTRDALLELEPAHVAFTAAIGQIGKAVERYPDAPQTREARYLLADSYRQASKWPRKKMKLVTIEATRAALARQSQLYLDNAVLEYDRLITELGDVQDSLNHTAMEKQVLRNSYFSKADALFDLGRYEDAIKAYSAASNRYQNEPESLGAYVQIAACYRLLNRPQEARGTLQQAQGVLLRMKPEAKFTVATPYTRDEWGTLLKWLGTL